MRDDRDYHRQLICEQGHRVPARGLPDRVRDNPVKIEAIRILLDRPRDWNPDALEELRKKLALGHLSPRQQDAGPGRSRNHLQQLPRAARPLR